MNAPDLKPIVDATTELTRKSVQTMTEMSTRVMKDVVAFGDTVAKTQADLFKNVPNNMFNDVYASVSKAQAEAVKTVTLWYDKFNSTK